MTIKKSIGLILFLSFFLLSACKKKEYILDFRVINYDYEGIYVIHQKTESSTIDTSFILEFDQLILHTEISDEPVIDYNLENPFLPFHYLEIQNINRVNTICDPNNLACWESDLNMGEDQFGSVILSINEFSF